MFLFIFLVLPPCAKPLTVRLRLLIESKLLIVVAGALGWLALGIVVSQHLLDDAGVVESKEFARVLLHKLFNGHA